jgi:hypothetical protein
MEYAEADYARGHPNVWFTGRSDIARTWREQIP